MANTALTVQKAVTTGLEPTFVAADAANNTFVNNGNTFIEVVNSHAGNAYTVTCVTAGTISGEAIADAATTLQAGVGERRIIGPFPVHVFNSAAGLVTVTYTGTQAATDVTIAAISLT